LVQARGSDAHERLLVAASEAMGHPVLPPQGRARRGDSRLVPPADARLVRRCPHAMASLECTAERLLRIRSNPRELMKRPNLLPKPLDEVVSKAWGYASEHARHGREDRKLDRAEVQLVVGLSAVVATYLLQKAGSDQ